MTIEEAIKILEYPVRKWSMDWDEREDGLSYADAIDMAISALRAQQESKPQWISVADRIRAMSDEELAKWLCSIMTAECCDRTCPAREKCGIWLGSGGDAMYNWLRQPEEG